MSAENDQWLKRDQTLIALWTHQRLNLERAIESGKSDDNMAISGFLGLLEHARMLDVMLVKSPRRMIMYGLEEKTLNSLKLVEELIHEIRTGEEVPLGMELNAGGI